MSDRESPRAKLYWCSSLKAELAWFVMAGNLADARRFFGALHDIHPGGVRVMHVRDLPAAYEDPEPASTPGEEVLQLCGAVFLIRSSPRVVVLDAVLYSESLLPRELLKQFDDDL